MPEDLEPEQRAEGWDYAAVGYEQRIAPSMRPYAEDVLDLAGLRAGERVLDVAAGPGTLAFAAAQRGAHVLATDFSPGMVARIQERARREKVPLEARVMDGQALDLPPASFDAAFSVFGLIFFPDRLRGLRELRRVLKPGGRVGIVGWSAPERMAHIQPLMMAMKALAPPKEPGDKEPSLPVHAYADEAVFRGELEQAGFRDVRIVTVTHPWRFADAKEYLAMLERSNPRAAMFEQLPPQARRAFQDIVTRTLREQGPGPYALPAEAKVGVGTVPR